MTRRRAASALIVVLAPALLQAQTARRGPLETREEWLPAQPRLQLPALAPDLLAPGRVALSLHFDWGNDFGWRQDGGGEAPADRRYLIDGEHRSLAFEVRRGLRPSLELGLRLPLHWRGGGSLDGLIDWFHGFTRKLGLPDNQRGRFLRDRLRILGRDAQGRALAWSGAAGTGLGRVELHARWALTRAARADAAQGGGWAVSLAPRLALPTGSGPFDVPGLEAGLQLAAAHGLGARADVFAGAGATVGGARRFEGLRYPRARPFAFAAFEWRPARVLSLLAQVDGAGRLLADVAQYASLQSYLRLGARLDLGRRFQLSAGFTENLVEQQATTDFGIFAGLTRR